MVKEFERLKNQITKLLQEKRQLQEQSAQEITALKIELNQLLLELQQLKQELERNDEQPNDGNVLNRLNHILGKYKI